MVVHIDGNIYIERVQRNVKESRICGKFFFTFHAPWKNL